MLNRKSQVVLSGLLGAVLVASVGCISNEQLSDEPEPEEVELDEAGQPVAVLSPIVINTRVAPQLVLYRRGVAGKWMAPAMVSASEYRGEVYSGYSVMVVCASTIMVESRLLAEGTSVEFPCGPLGPAPAADVVVDVSMKQPGSIVASWGASSGSPDWTGQFRVTPKVRDVFAFDANYSRLAIRRNVDLSASVTLPKFDLDREAAPLVPVTFTPPPLGANEASSLWSEVTDGETRFFFPGSSFRTPVVPTALLVNGTKYFVKYVSSQARIPSPSGVMYSALRRMDIPYRLGNDTTITPWNAFTDPAFDAEALSPYVTWATRDLSAGLELKVSQSSLSTGTRLARHRASRRYLQAAKPTRLAIDFSAPGIPTDRLFDPKREGTFVSVLATRDTPAAPAQHEYSGLMPTN